MITTKKKFYIAGLISVSVICFYLAYQRKAGLDEQGSHFILPITKKSSEWRRVELDKYGSVQNSSTGRQTVQGTNSSVVYGEPHSSSYNPSCQPVKRLAFTKIEKTGSTTLFSIFARFILKHRLSVLMPYDGVHIDWREARYQNWDSGPGGVDKADTLVSHSRYNEDMLNKYLHEGYTRIVSVRDAESWIKSAATYFRVYWDVKSVEEVILDDSLLFKQRNKTGVGYWLHNFQLQWLGLHKRDVNNITAIKQHISKVVSRFELPMINDEFDASLVILRRRLCWEYTDILYTKKIVTKSSTKKGISDFARQKLLSEKANLGDQLLYEAMKEKWRESPEQRHPDFWEEVEYFSKLNSNISFSVCQKVLKTHKAALVEESKWHPDLHITPKLCLELRYSNDQQINILCNWALNHKCLQI